MCENAEPDPRSPGTRVERAELTETEKYKVVSIRLRAAEFEGFRDQAKKLGITSNLALRIAARRIAGFLEVDPGTRQQLESILSAIGEVSRNIRDLHADYIASGRVDLHQLDAQRAAFGQEFAELDALLRAILNVSRRRSDGRRKLAGAIT
jgi:type IV secretion system T-DNA border endonuclease VirD1